MDPADQDTARQDFLRPILELREAHIRDGHAPPAEILLGQKERKEAQFLGLIFADDQAPQIEGMRVDFVDKESFLQLAFPDALAATPDGWVKTPFTPPSTAGQNCQIPAETAVAVPVPDKPRSPQDPPASPSSSGGSP